MARAYVMTSPTGKFTSMTIERREVESDDVAIDIEYCGLCHSDVHTVRSEWGKCNYPMAPGHEIVGTVREVGKNVTDFKSGDKVGVGCMVDACRKCSYCKEGRQQFCEKGSVGTYDKKDYWHNDEITQGGYTSDIVVHQDFVLRIPKGMDLASAAPLLCAGITTYSPLNHWNVGPDSKVAVAGLGGLGHMAVKIAHAMGAEVTVFTRTDAKAEDAKKLGADKVIISSDKEQMKAATCTFDLIIDAVSATHDLNPYLNALAVEGTLVLLGIPETPHPNIAHRLLLGKRASLSASPIGGIKETQEMLDFCAEHNIAADIEMVNAEQLDEAYERMVAGDVRYRFVLDSSTL
ncbi:MAG: NAD(P)-dependent alcohol dehydrogenase [Micrococcaceae bacterium]